MFRNNWSAFLLPNSVTGILRPDELEDMRATMDEATFMQEVECSFDAAIKGAIFAGQIADLRARHRVTEVKYSNLLPVYTAWDLGYDDATSIWFFQLAGGEPRFIDYYENAQKGLDHYAQVLANKGYRYAKNYLPHDIQVHELGTGKSRASVLQSLGVRVTPVPKLANKEDGHAAARALLSRCYFDEENCGDGVDRLAMYRREWDALNAVFRLKAKHDWTSHAADAFITAALGVRLAPVDEAQYGRMAELE